MVRRLHEAVWLIGGGLIQLLMAQEIKRRGYRLICTDRDLLTQGCLLADEAYPLDTYDVPGHLGLARSFKERPIAVLTFGADVGPTVSKVCEFYKLPAATYRSAEGARNKAVMRALLEQEHPRYVIVPPGMSAAQVRGLWSGGYPCVVKPVDNCASRGVRVVRSAGEWAEALGYSRQHAKHNQTLLVEEYLECRAEWATDWLVDRDDTLFFLMGVERYFLRPGIELACTVPMQLPDSLWQQMQSLARVAAQRLQVNGPLKIDFILTQHGLLIGECATRQSGGVDQYTYPWVTGVNLAGVALDYSLGKFVEPKSLKIKTPGAYAAHMAPVYRAGKINGWSGIKEARETEGALDVFVRELNEIRCLEDGAARPLFVAAKGANQSEALYRCSQMGALIRPLYAG